MAGKKISALTELTSGNVAGTDLVPVVDVSDTTDAATGTTKKTLLSSIATYLQTALASTFAALSHTHAASDITSGTLADARVAESNVTQHEAALSITESQISDLSHEDEDAIHVSLSDEIAPITGKSTPVDADVFLIEDSAASNAKKSLSWANLKATLKTYFDTLYAAVSHAHATSDITSGTFADARIAQSNVTQHQAALSITESQISDLNHTDTAAIHDNVSGEISLITEKASPVSGDLLIIEDSAASNAKKKVQIGNLPSSGISNVVEDTTPQLGGDLDINGNAIKSSTTGARLRLGNSDTDGHVRFDSQQTLNSSSGTDKFFKGEITVNGSGTQGYTAIELDVTETATGSGTKRLLDLKVGASSKFSVNNKGGANSAGTISFASEIDNGNSSTADTVDWTAGNKQRSTLTGNCTFTFTAPSGPCNLILKLIQDGTGSRTVTWPATVKWPSGSAPTLSTAASSIDIVSFYYDGTNYFGQAGLNFS